jgi:hypothetical protein
LRAYHPDTDSVSSSARARLKNDSKPTWTN